MDKTSRDKLNELIKKYMDSIAEVDDGNATKEEMEAILEILDDMRFYTIRVLFFKQRI
ncbi:MAG: hypothetical protein ACR2MX_01670 [Cyclobacteriaceae bacterium]